MSRNFGSTGVSSLLRAATAGVNQAASYADSEQAYIYDMSAKTQADLDTYQTYLNKRVADTQNVDPTKALTLQRTLTTANRSYTSAEISRATTNVEFGNQSNRDKYGQIVDLYNKAQANGDDNLAQSLAGRLASLSVTIQNEDKANANAATTAGDKQAAAVKKSYTDAIAHNELGIKTLDAAKAAGQITPAEYENQKAQLYQGNGSTPGIISLTKSLADNETANGDQYGTYNQKLIGDANIQKYSNDVGNAKRTGMDNSTVVTPNGDGTYSFNKRPQSEVASSTPITDKNGKPIPGASSQTYALPQGFTGKDGNINGIQFVGNIAEKRDANGNVIPDPGNGKYSSGTGAGALYQYNSNMIFHNDPSGVGYIILPNGQKKFVGYEPKTDSKGNSYNQAVYTNKADDIKNMPGVKYDGGGVGKLNLGEGPSASSIKGIQSRSQASEGGFSNSAGPGAVLNKLLGQNSLAQQRTAALVEQNRQTAAARATMMPTVAARVAAPAVPANITPAAAKVIAMAPINTPTVSQAQAASANYVGTNGGYQTNIQAPKAPQGILAKVGSWLGF